MSHWVLVLLASRLTSEAIHRQFRHEHRQFQHEFRQNNMPHSPMLQPVVIMFDSAITFDAKLNVCMCLA
jgi:hypothetical protein